MGKLYYFTNLNLAASYGDDFPKINHDFQGSVAVRSVFLKGRCLNLEFINNNPSCINHIPCCFFMAESPTNVVQISIKTINQLGGSHNPITDRFQFFPRSPWSDEPVIWSHPSRVFESLLAGSILMCVISTFSPHENYWLVVEPYPSEKYDESSVGMMTFPIYRK